MTKVPLSLIVCQQFVFVSYICLSVYLLLCFATENQWVSYSVLISSLLLIIICGYIILVSSLIYRPDPLYNPTLPFSIIITFITFNQVSCYRNPIAVWCSSLTNTPLRIINFIITSLLLSVFIALSPFLAIWTILFLNIVSDEGVIIGSILYELSMIILSIIFHAISLSIIKPENNISIILYFIGMVYCILTVFMFYQIKQSAPNLQPLKYIIFPLAVSMEIVLLFQMIFITFMVQTQYWMLTVIAFLNFVFLNIPFYKSYITFKHMDWMNSSQYFKFVITNCKNKSNDMFDRFYAILHEYSHTNTHGNARGAGNDNHYNHQFFINFVDNNNDNGHNDAGKEQERLNLLLNHSIAESANNNNIHGNHGNEVSVEAMQFGDYQNHFVHEKMGNKCIKSKYEFIEKKCKQKEKFVNGIIRKFAVKRKHEKYNNMFEYIHMISSIIAFAFPTIWFYFIYLDVWLSNNDAKIKFVFICMINVFYVVFILICAVYIYFTMDINSKTEFSIIKCLMKLEMIDEMDTYAFRSSNNMSNVRNSYQTFPVIQTVLKYTYFDIGLIVLQFLYQEQNLLS